MRYTALKKLAETLSHQDNNRHIKICCNCLLNTIRDRLGFKKTVLRLAACGRGSLIVGACGLTDSFAVWSADEARSAIWKDAAGNSGPVLINDITRDKRAVPYREIFRKEGIRSALSVPLATQGEMIAGIEAYGERTGQFTHEDGERLRDAGTFLLEALVALVLPAGPKRRSVLLGYPNSDEIEHLKFFHKLIFENIPIGVLATDAKGYVILMNKELECMSSQAREECLGKRWYEVFGFKGEIRTKLETSFRTSSAWFFPEIHLPLKDGSTQPVEMKTDIIRDYSGRTLGVIAICSDITEKKRIEREIEKVERLAAIGKLSSAVAHEIRNPLAGISGALQAIRRKVNGDAELDKVFNRIFEEIVRLNNVVGRLQDLTSPGKMRFDLHSISDIVEDSIFFVRKSLANRGIKLTKKLDPALKLIRMDKSAIKQVILNILINAINSMPDGGNLSVRATTVDSLSSLEPGITWHRTLYASAKTQESVSPPYLAVIIADNGIGISQPIIPKIFDAFFSTFDGGTGLGLYISSTIVALHSGMIGCRSEEKKGSVFYLLLPIRDE